MSVEKKGCMTENKHNPKASMPVHVTDGMLSCLLLQAAIQGGNYKQDMKKEI